MMSIPTFDLLKAGGTGMPIRDAQAASPASPASRLRISGAEFTRLGGRGLTRCGVILLASYAKETPHTCRGDLPLSRVGTRRRARLLRPIGGCRAGRGHPRRRAPVGARACPAHRPSGPSVRGAGTADALSTGTVGAVGMMPATAAAYATVSRAAVPRATTIINVFQRVGGSLGSALLAVVLEDQIKAGVPSALRVTGGSIGPLPPAVRERLATPLTEAFNHSFWWAVALTALAILPAIVVAAKAPKPAASDSRANPLHARGDVFSQRQLHDAPPRPQPSHASTG